MISVRDAVCECETGGTLYSQTLAGRQDTAEQVAQHMVQALLKLSIKSADQNVIHDLTNP